MIRRIFLLLGLGLVGIGAILGLFDATRSLASTSLDLTPLGATWYQVHSSSLNLMQALVQRYLLPEIWDPGIQTVLQWPSSIVIGVLGFVLMFFARKKRNLTENRAPSH